MLYFKFSVFLSNLFFFFFHTLCKQLILAPSVIHQHTFAFRIICNRTDSNHSHEFAMFYGTLDNDDTNGSASDVRDCELWLLLSTIVHRIWRTPAHFIQPQVFGDVFENAILFGNIHIDGHIRFGFSEAFATSKYTTIFQPLHIFCS